MRRMLPYLVCSRHSRCCRYVSRDSSQVIPAGLKSTTRAWHCRGRGITRCFTTSRSKLLRDYGINQFKLDGTGSPDKVTPGSAFDSDFAAAIALIGDLRAVEPDLFINLTTGTWPSPFWLRTADSIWRGGEDHSFAGTGSDRQRWITYRDADTYGGIVRQAAVPAQFAAAARDHLRAPRARAG